MKTVCIYHGIDLDGWMSAAIAKHWFESVNDYPDNIGKGTIDFIGYNYGQAIPNLSEYDRIIMVDISFPKEIMLDINKRLGEKFIWIDHHQRTVDEVNSYIIEHGIPMEGLVTEPGELKAACELTWEYFFPKQPMPEIVRLLGRYDCFGHKGTDEELKVLQFQYAARSFLFDVNGCYEMLCSTFNEQIWIQIGGGIYQYLCVEAKQSYKNGFPVKFGITSISGQEAKTYKFIVINKERFNPINFGIDYHADGYDGAACFHYANGKWNFSLYNDNGLVDCSTICKTFGGGGHAGAAGFVTNNIIQFIIQ